MTGVLFLTESFHPVLGGGEQHIRSLAAALAASGFRATVVTRRGQAAWPAEEILDGVRVVRVRPGGPGRRGKYAMVPFVLRALAREAASFDVLVVRGTRVLGLPGLLAGRVLQKPVVLQPDLNGELSGEVYTWGTPLHTPWVRRVVGAATAARNVLMADADAFVAMSRRIREECLQSGLDPERVALIPHGVDTERFRPASAQEAAELRRSLGIDPRALVVVYTGRLLRGKGLEVLVDAFAEVARQRERAHLLVVGSGAGQALSVEGPLRERVDRAGLASRVTFTGRVDRVEDYLRASDVFAFPSLFEALGLSLLEAAACGLPSVGSRTGGIVDVIEDGGSGVLVNPGDVAGLAGALVRLLGDPGFRAALGARGRALARARFDARDSLERYRTLLAELAPAPRGQGAP